MKKKIRKILKVFLIFITSILILLLLIIGAIRLPVTQNYLIGKAENFLKNKLNTELSIGAIKVVFPKSISLEEVYMEDLKGDTLLFMGGLEIDTDLYGLFQSEINLNSVELERLDLNLIKNDNDSVFNYQFIADAFSSPADTIIPKSSKGSVWKFSAEDINMLNLDFFYLDAPLNSEIKVAWEELDVSFKEINLDSMKFILSSIVLSNADLDLSIYGGNEDVKEPSSGGLPFEIQSENLEIENSTFGFRDSTMSIAANIGKVNIESDFIDIEKVKFVLPKVSLKNTDFELIMKESADIPENQSTDSSVSPELVFDDLLVDNSNFKLQMKEKEYPVSFDPLNLDLKNLNTQIKKFHYRLDDLKGEIQALSLISDNKLTINQASGNIIFTDRQLNLQNLILQTDETNVKADFMLGYTSLDSLMSNKTKIDLKVNPSRISFKDLSYVNPIIKNQLPFINVVALNGEANGTFSNMNVSNFSATSLNSTKLKLNGRLFNLGNPENLSYELSPFQFSSTRKDILKVLPDSLKPLSVNLPERISLVVQGNGSVSDFNGGLDLKSTFGHLKMIVNKSVFTESKLEYDFTLISDSLDVGDFIQMPDQLNNLAIDISAKGSGSNFEEMNTVLDASLRNITYNSYLYDTLRFNAEVLNGKMDYNLKMIDKFLQFNLGGLISKDKDSYRADIMLNLKKADLEQLKLSNTPLKLQTVFSADIQTDDFDRFNGNLAIRKFSANNGIGTYKMDSLLVASISQKDKTEIVIDSDILEGELKGNIDLLKVSDVLINHINQYYYISDVAKHPDESIKIDLNFNLKNTELITEVLVPGLDEFNPGKLVAVFDSDADKFKLDLGINHLLYNGIAVDSLAFRAESFDKHIISFLKVDEISSSDTKVSDLALKAEFSNDELDYRFSIRDSLKELKYLIKGNYEQAEDVSTFHLAHDTLMLASHLWTVPADNYLKFLPDGVETNNLSLTYNKQKVDFLAKSTDDSIFKVLFENFSLATFSAAVENNMKVISGKVNGSIDVPVADSEKGITANITISKLKYFEELIGDLFLKIDRKNEDIYNGLMTLKSDINDISLRSEYSLSGDNNDIDLDINAFAMSTLKPFLKGVVDNPEGLVKGKLNLSGSFVKPSINGTVSFDKVSLTPTIINNRLTVDNEKIVFNNSKILFNKLKITDQNNATATIDGHIKMNELTFFLLDLNLKTNNFMVLNTAEKDNEMYYGKLWLTGNASVKGSSSYPKVSVNLKVGDESNVTYVIPETEFNVLNKENIVRFVDHSKSNFVENETFEIDSAVFEGIDFSSKIEINKNATFNIVIDPITQDKLSVKGDATLNLTLNRKGEIQLSGRYTLSEGGYKFSFYKLIQRDFQIEKGSSLTWSGDPFNARLDIKAYNVVEAAPIDLLQNQISNASEQELNRYKQRLPFLVYLNIKGQLLQPDISFKLDMKDENRYALGGVVYSKIQDLNSRESDLNKQVFALLVLKRFISDNPLKSQGGYSLEDNARRSVSRILSDQLNRLTDGVKGVNLDFNLESYQDFSGGQAQNATQLELGISKNLLDDRLIVKISGNVNVEGGNQENLSDYVGDLALEYKITEDGRFRVTGFRRGDFDVVSGEVIETGTGLIYIRDYNLLSELFKKVKEK